MPITKNRTVALFLFCILASYLPATTVTLIVTPNGIAMASDSGESTHSGDYSSSTKGVTKKFFIVKNRIVVSSVGMADVSLTTNKGTVSYSFLDWMKAIEHRLPADVSVDDLASTIERESAATFKEFDSVLKRNIWQNKKPLENCRLFVQYIIAGYDDPRSPKVHVVQFDIDWGKKELVGPKRIQLFPGYGATGNYVFYSFGVKEALDDVSAPDSYAHKMIFATCAECKTLFDRREITISQSIEVAKAFVRVEEKTNPIEVFGLIVGGAVLPSGGILGLGSEYRKTGAKPKPKATEKKEIVGRQPAFETSSAGFNLRVTFACYPVRRCV